jgi:hypothetical protein
MLTPDEANQLKKLQEKENTYLPLTEKDINEIDAYTLESANIVGNEFLGANEAWKRICYRLENLSKNNRRLLMEIHYLNRKKERSKSEGR